MAEDGEQCLLSEFSESNFDKQSLNPSCNRPHIPPGKPSSCTDKHSQSPSNTQSSVSESVAGGDIDKVLKTSSKVKEILSHIAEHNSPKLLNHVASNLSNPHSSDGQLNLGTQPSRSAVCGEISPMTSSPAVQSEIMIESNNYSRRLPGNDVTNCVEPVVRDIIEQSMEISSVCQDIIPPKTSAPQSKTSDDEFSMSVSVTLPATAKSPHCIQTSQPVDSTLDSTQPSFNGIANRSAIDTYARLSDNSTFTSAAQNFPLPDSTPPIVKSRIESSHAISDIQPSDITQNSSDSHVDISPLVSENSPRLGDHKSMSSGHLSVDQNLTSPRHGHNSTPAQNNIAVDNQTSTPLSSVHKSMPPHSDSESIHSRQDHEAMKSQNIMPTKNAMSEPLSTNQNCTSPRLDNQSVSAQNNMSVSNHTSIPTDNFMSSRSDSECSSPRQSTLAHPCHTSTYLSPDHTSMSLPPDHTSTPLPPDHNMSTPSPPDHTSTPLPPDHTSTPLPPDHTSTPLGSDFESTRQRQVSVDSDSINSLDVVSPPVGRSENVSETDRGGTRRDFEDVLFDEKSDYYEDSDSESFPEPPPTVQLRPYSKLQMLSLFDPKSKRPECLPEYSRVVSTKILEPVAYNLPKEIERAVWSEGWIAEPIWMRRIVQQRENRLTRMLRELYPSVPLLTAPDSGRVSKEKVNSIIARQFEAEEEIKRQNVDDVDNEAGRSNQEHDDSDFYPVKPNPKRASSSDFYPVKPAQRSSIKKHSGSSSRLAFSSESPPSPPASPVSSHFDVLKVRVPESCLLDYCGGNADKNYPKDRPESELSGIDSDTSDLESSVDSDSDDKYLTFKPKVDTIRSPDAPTIKESVVSTRKRVQLSPDTQGPQKFDIDDDSRFEVVKGGLQSSGFHESDGNDFNVSPHRSSIHDNDRVIRKNREVWDSSDRPSSAPHYDRARDSGSQLVRREFPPVDRASDVSLDRSAVEQYVRGLRGDGVEPVVVRPLGSMQFSNGPPGFHDSAYQSDQLHHVNHLQNHAAALRGAPAMEAGFKERSLVRADRRQPVDGVDEQNLSEDERIRRFIWRKLLSMDFESWKIRYAVETRGLRKLPDCVQAIMTLPDPRSENRQAYSNDSQPLQISQFPANDQNVAEHNDPSYQTSVYLSGPPVSASHARDTQPRDPYSIPPYVEQPVNYLGSDPSNSSFYQRPYSVNTGISRNASDFDPYFNDQYQQLSHDVYSGAPQRYPDQYNYSQYVSRDSSISAGVNPQMQYDQQFQDFSLSHPQQHMPSESHQLPHGLSLDAAFSQNLQISAPPGFHPSAPPGFHPMAPPACRSGPPDSQVHLSLPSIQYASGSYRDPDEWISPERQAQINPRSERRIVEPANQLMTPPLRRRDPDEWLTPDRSSGGGKVLIHSPKVLLERDREPFAASSEHLQSTSPNAKPVPSHPVVIPETLTASGGLQVFVKLRELLKLSGVNPRIAWGNFKENGDWSRDHLQLACERAFRFNQEQADQVFAVLVADDKSAELDSFRRPDGLFDVVSMKSSFNLGDPTEKLEDCPNLMKELTSLKKLQSTKEADQN
eukprot:73757_1